jgi:hypothetical protein
MRPALATLSALLILAGGCRPNEEAVPGGDTRPGAAQDDSGTDRSPAGSGSENNAPPVRPSPNPPASAPPG